jgi:hypothetical protein
MTNNPNGRNKGVPNKLTGIHREFYQSILDSQNEKIISELDKLEGIDYLRIIIQLSEFVIPKIQRIDLSSNFKERPKVGLDAIEEVYE